MPGINADSTQHVLRDSIFQPIDEALMFGKKSKLKSIHIVKPTDDRSDRTLVRGSGIPSGEVVFVREDGTTGALVRCGGGVCTNDTLPDGTILPIYWLQD
jgi:hypothetical protein